MFALSFGNPRRTAPRNKDPAVWCCDLTFEFPYLVPRPTSCTSVQQSPLVIRVSKLALDADTDFCSSRSWLFFLLTDIERKILKGTHGFRYVSEIELINSGGAWTQALRLLQAIPERSLQAATWTRRMSAQPHIRGWQTSGVPSWSGSWGIQGSSLFMETPYHPIHRALGFMPFTVFLLQALGCLQEGSFAMVLQKAFQKS